MKKKAFLCAVAAALIAVAGLYGYNTNKLDKCPSMYDLNSVEAIAACESIGWWDNDGNCVKNSDSNEYFCKDDSWYELTDCKK